MSLSSHTSKRLKMDDQEVSIRFQFSFDNILLFLFVVILATLLLALNSQPLSAQAESDVICGRVVEATGCEQLTSTLRVALQRCDGGPPLLLPARTNIGNLGVSVEIHGPKLRPVEKFYCSNEHGFLLEELFEATSATLADSCPATCTDDVLQENKKHRHIIFLGGINSTSSATSASPDEKPINGDFDRIRDALKKAGFGQFAYFSYSARAKPRYCMGWEGGESGKCPTSGDLTELSAYPVYDTNDTHQDIIEQAAVLNWLIGQIIQRDPQARIDLIGFSLGGVVASYWASQNGVSSLDHDTYHDNIHSIILINSPVGGFAVAEPFLNCSGDVLDKIKCEIWSHILREGIGFPGSIKFPGFGQTVLTQLQDPTANASSSIVDELSQTVVNYPRLVSIQSTSDYMVNGRSLTLCRALVSCGLGSTDATIGIGTQSLHWPPSAMPKMAELGGRGIAARPINLEHFPGLLSENHNAALAHPQTAAWIIQAVEPAKLDVVPLLEGFGPESEWEPSPDADAAVYSCIDQTSDQQACLIDTMRRFGALPQAITVAEQMGNEGYLAHFQEIGMVDLGFVTYPLAANSNFGNPILLNGAPSIILVNDRITEDELSGNLVIQNDPIYSSLVSQFPEIMRDTTVSFESAEQLSFGGQRFIFRSSLLNGCRACEQLGVVQIALDFDEVGKFLGTELLSIDLVSGTTSPFLSQLPTALVNISSLNVRAGPGISYARISAVHQSDTLQVIGRNNDCSWLQIVTPTGVQGWIATQYVTLGSACDSIVTEERTTTTAEITTSVESTPAAGKGIPGVKEESEVIVNHKPTQKSDGSAIFVQIFAPELGAVWDVAFSPDGAMLAAATDSGLWLTLPGSESATALATTNPLSSLSWSPDGALLATGVGDVRNASDSVGLVYVWEISAGAPLLTLDGPEAAVLTVAWSPDGAWLAAGAADERLYIWDAATGELRAMLSGQDADVTSVSWSPDSTLLAAAGDDGIIHIWQPTTGEEVLTINAHPDGTTWARLSPDSALLATGGADEALVIWDTTTGAPLLELNNLSGEVTNLAWSLDGKMIAAATQLTDHNAEGYLLRVWNASTGVLQHNLVGLTAPVTGISWSADGLQLVAGERDGTLILWELTDYSVP